MLSLYVFISNFLLYICVGVMYMIKHYYWHIIAESVIWHMLKCMTYVILACHNSTACEMLQDDNKQITIF